MEETAPVIEPWADGSAFLVKAHAGARREGVSGLHDGMIKVDVTIAPEKGKANKAIVKVLARALGVPPADLTLLSGETNPRKRFGVARLAPSELAERMRSVLRSR